METTIQGLGLKPKQKKLERDWAAVKVTLTDVPL